MGVPKPGYFKPGCLQFLRASALLHVVAPFLRPFAFFCELVFAFFALICALLRAFACFCVRLRLERPLLGTAETYKDKHQNWSILQNDETRQMSVTTTPCKPRGRIIFSKQPMSVIVRPQSWGRSWLHQFYGQLAFLGSSAHKIPPFRGGG